MGTFKGKGSAWSKQKDKACEKCKSKEEVYYTGGSVTHGNLYTPAADTEVEFYYECTKCGYEWVEYA